MTQPPPRPPADAVPAPIGALAVLPVFFRLQGRRVLLAGGSEGAAWKAELLLAAGAAVAVFAPAPSARMRELAGKITLHEARWQPGDFAGAALAIGDVSDDAEAVAFSTAAKAAGVPVNLVDRPAFCDFQFGSIVERSPLVIGISTDGAAPVFGQAIRARIEALLPQGFRNWAQAARDWRPAVQALGLGFRDRRTFWERFAQMALARPGEPPTEADRAALMAQAQTGPGQSKGFAVLVGAGPGDPELVTLKAVRALQSADVVLYDDLVSPRVVEMARREAARINVGKRGYKPSCTQEDISALIVALALEGKRVVRLKGGDPMIFGRANEEIAALRAADVPVEIIPGVTSASAAAAALQASLTERDVARRVQFITAHGRDGHLPRDLDWAALADPRATTVVYMGVKTLGELAAKLITQGLPATTPAAMVEHASWANQRTVRSTIAELPGVLAGLQPKGPCLILIGLALAEAARARCVEIELLFPSPPAGEGGPLGPDEG